MENYPEAVAKIANDYLDRVRLNLHAVPPSEQADFLNEIRAHIYDAYQQAAGEDEIARILAVLRNFGEPADVVADRLPAAMVREGAKRNLPLFILSGILIALFGVPMGFGGICVLTGLLAALTGLTIAFFAITGSTLLVGSVFMLIGLSRYFFPGVFDRLVEAGIIHMEGPFEFINQFAPAEQGMFFIIVASIILAAGLGMLWLGKRMLRGLRFLAMQLFDWARRLAQTLRKQFREYRTSSAAAMPDRFSTART